MSRSPFAGHDPRSLLRGGIDPMCPLFLLTEQKRQGQPWDRVPILLASETFGLMSGQVDVVRHEGVFVNETLRTQVTDLGPVPAARSRCEDGEHA